VIVKNLKLVILACGGALLGIYVSDGLNFSDNAADTIIFLAAYALPTLMGLLALIKPPAMAWHGAIALSGFGTAAVRSKVWDSFGGFGELSGKGKAGVILLVVGVLVSILAMLKPENKT
jgi:hypothetical protein